MKRPEHVLPDILPDGLDSRQYYELGLRYRLSGLVEKAKKSLSLAIELGPGTPTAIKAAVVLKHQLPRAFVPPDAEQRNIQAYNLMDTNPQLAKSIFAELMVKYPDFEWPFSNTAKLLLEEGNLKKAKSIARYLDSVNPNSMRSAFIALQIALKEGDFKEAGVRAERLAELAAGDEQVKTLAAVLKLQTVGLPPDTIPEKLGPEEYYNLATSYLVSGRFDLSRQAAEKCLEVAEPCMEHLAVKARSFIQCRLPRRPLTKEVQRRVEESCRNAKTNKAAIADLEQLYNDEPNEIIGCALSTVYIEEKNLDKAERFAAMSSKLNPDFLQAKLILVQICMMQNQHEKAIEIIEKYASDTVEDLTLDLIRAECQRALLFSSH